MQALFGETLLTKDGLKPIAEVLKDKTAVGVYFSAHWCPPCRGFTPKLAESYTDHLKAKGLEIVFVSSDREEESFNSYFGEQPWVALPYEDRERKEALSKKFKVRGIPTFVVLDPSGAVITEAGRNAIAKDPTGEEYPWAPKPLRELLAGDLLGKDGAVPASALQDKVVGLYFSAHWCPPCRGFTPQLVEQYEKIKAAGLPFEIVFASSDREEGQFKDYFAEMPWLALPYEERSRKEALSERFGVNGIPSLVLLDKDLSVITTEGRGAVMQDISNFPFLPKPVSDMGSTCAGINECTAVIVLAETSGKESVEEACKAMTPLAEEYLAAAKAKGDDPEVRFYFSAGGGPAPMIRAKCQLEAVVAPHEHPLEETPANGGWVCDGCGGNTAPRFRCTKGCDFDYCAACNAKLAEGPKTMPAQLVVLNIPDNGAYYTPECALTTDGLRAMLADLKAGSLTRKQMG